MDNHPIPQDVTGFQFRLIGDMTVKQFAYVAVGGVLAVVFLYAPFPFVLRIPFMILFGGIGLALAFMPLEGRPLDVMVGYFFKALIMPNQYAYHKTGGHISLFGYQTKPPVVQTAQANPAQMQSQTPQMHHQNEDKEKKLSSYLTQLHEQNLSPLEQRERAYIQGLSLPRTQGAPVEPPKNSPHIFQREESKPTPQMQQPVQSQAIQVTQTVQQQAPLPEPVESKKEPETPQTLTLQENVLSQELNHAKQEEMQQTDTLKKQAVHSHVTTLEEQLLEIQRQKEQLEKELAGLKAQVGQTQPNQAQTAPPSESSPAQTQPQTSTQQTSSQAEKTDGEASVRKITAEMAKNLGLPHVPDVPNLIIGIVKDPRGNVLSNILVEVKDQEGTPARAFRTNQLGQFASATPLSDGTYTIEFEDPKGQHLFDTIQITADNQILMPIEVISHDEREELRKALFN